MSIFKFFTRRRTRFAAGITIFLRAIFVATFALAAAGGTVTAPTEVAPGIPIAANINFELETTPNSLKEEPTWNEVEQMLDNPYAIAAIGVEGNPQGFSSYISTTQRRRSYLYTNANGDVVGGCSYDAAAGLPLCDDSIMQPFLIHPLNYNHMNGEELRLLNPEYPGGLFDVPSHYVQCGVGDPDEPPFCEVETTANSLNGPVVSPANDPNRYVWVYETLEISAGDDRVEETSIDHNSPMAPDVDTTTTTYPATYGGDPVCMVTTEVVPPENSILCGGDPGIPGYAGFGVFDDESYSTPAVPGSTKTSAFGPLVDPAGCGDRNSTLGGAGSCIGQGEIVRLLKPTLRPTPNEVPLYVVNSIANLTANGEDSLEPSNENDYVQNRGAATVLGKALFWDMQVGSDGVQSCGSCHFSAGADDRIKNQINPNHIGGDLTFEVAQPNEEVTVSDFPFATQENEIYNDVMSSMGVHWGMFQDIPEIGTFITNASGVDVLPMDLREDNPLDPIGGFAGITGNEFRRVEPRNTPTMISAAFNFDNFWDGRARHDFNGGSVFGPSDPGYHVFVNSGLSGGNGSQIVATRQIIRNSSAASQATGPVLSEFEMSFFGRNWPKVGKKLLQNGVTPLANQLVDTTDSVMGIYSNQGGSACASLAPADWSGDGTTAPGKPGLCISYPALIRQAFYPALWQNPVGGGPARHLDGATGADPFDSYVLTPASGQSNATDTNQFSLSEANFSLFFGLSVQIWEEILVPDNAPFDQFMEANPDSFKSLGEPGEAGLVWDMLGCDQTGGVQPCFTAVSLFQRDPGVPLNLEGGPGVTTGNRQPGDPDPLLGFDMFYGFNLSGKNPDFRMARCGECHAGATTTDHTFGISNQLSFGDFVAEFSLPGVEIPIEPLGRSRMISGFGLESELTENAQDAIERRIINQSVFNPADGLTYPDGQAFFDNGIYNIGVTPIDNDISRGGDDPFGFPLSLGRLMLWNLGGIGQQPEVPLSNFDPDLGTTGGLFGETAQDQQINPGHEEEPENPLLPPYLAPFASNVPVGDEVQQDEVGGGGAGMVNTFHEIPLLEGFVDTLGPFNPAGTVGENYNMAPELLMGTWPTVNRVGFMGSFKAPSIRNSELTGPFFHNGGKLTLGQVIDFYARGGDFPLTNAHHRDFNIMDLLQDQQALGGLSPEEQNDRLVALIDFILTLTDERVRYEQAPFDHPEIFVPLDGRAPENAFGRPGLLAGTTGDVNGVDSDCFGIPGAGACYLYVPAVGAAGTLTPVDSFMGLTTIRPNEPGFNCSATAGPISHYCFEILP